MKLAVESGPVEAEARVVVVEWMEALGGVVVEMEVVVVEMGGNFIKPMWVSLIDKISF